MARGGGVALEQLRQELTCGVQICAGVITRNASCAAHATHAHGGQVSVHSAEDRVGNGVAPPGPDGAGDRAPGIVQFLLQAVQGDPGSTESAP